MVIVNIFAGLGNQMFQYATARRLALKLGVELKLDLSSFDRCQFRKYQLDRFCISSQVASAAEVQALCGQERHDLVSRAARKARYLMNRQLGFRWGGLVKEKHFHFDPAMLTLPDNVYLFGLWQTEKYFVDSADAIRADFQLRDAPAGRNAELISTMKETREAVSLHVRRGDYVSDPHSNQSHGVCGLDYYQRAIEHMTRSLASPHFFVFSDDIAWARENLRLPSLGTFIDHNGPDHGVEDVRLMSHCQHHIIANSSFSWWGAWLNPSKGKIVCAPRQWFGLNAKKQRSAVDVIPASWEVL
jgi:hypothetical protein